VTRGELKFKGQLGPTLTSWLRILMPFPDTLPLAHISSAFCASLHKMLNVLQGENCTL